MFSKLQEQAARIDSSIRTLESKLPEVMHGYTDMHPDVQPIIDRKTQTNHQIGTELRGFLQENETFEKLLQEVFADTDDIENCIQQIAQTYKLEHCMVKDNVEPEEIAAEDTNRETPMLNSLANGPDSESSANESFDMTNIMVPKLCVPGQSSALVTPLFRSSKTKSKQPAGPIHWQCPSKKHLRF